MAKGVWIEEESDEYGDVIRGRSILFLHLQSTSIIRPNPPKPPGTLPEKTQPAPPNPFISHLGNNSLQFRKARTLHSNVDTLETFRQKTEGWVYEGCWGWGGRKEGKEEREDFLFCDWSEKGRLFQRIRLALLGYLIGSHGRSHVWCSKLCYVWSGFAACLDIRGGTELGGE